MYSLACDTCLEIVVLRVPIIRKVLPSLLTALTLFRSRIDLPPLRSILAMSVRIHTAQT